MEGCAWQDNGDGTFTTTEVLNEISELDEYLFGLRPASQVSPMFVLDDPNPVPPAGDAAFPFLGFTTSADRIDFTIEDIIAENGPRVPDASIAPHHFTMAFVLIVPQGTAPLPADLAYLEDFRNEWEEYFHQETEQAGTMTTTLPQVPAVADFIVDRFAGIAPLTVSFTARPSGTVNSLLWDFGDGSPASSEIRPVHVYGSTGTFVAKLTVMGPSGPSEKTMTIRVGPFSTVVEHTFESGPQGWALAPPNTAPAGRWEWGDPEGTSTFGVFVQPEDDHTAAGIHCWTTDKDAGSFPSDRDVDGGITTLRSPVFDLSTTNDPYVSYARWYSNSLAGNSDEDSMWVEVSTNGGGNWIRLETVFITDTKWNTAQFRLSDFIALTPSVCFRVQASDFGGQSLVEAAFDDFEILDLEQAVAGAPPIGAKTAFQLRPNRPNPFTNTTVLLYELPSTRSVTVSVFDLGGRLVRILENGVRDAGLREISWDGRDEAGRSVASGVYVVRVESREGSAARKIQVVH
jgi:PKD repeat protein